jgi:hypothetical protein
VRQVLSAVWERDQNDVDTAGSLGYLELVGGNLDKAVTVLTRGLTLAPNRDQYRLLLGVALMRQRDLDGATRQLGVLLARGATAEIRDQARSMLTQVAALRNAAIGQPAPSIPTPPVTVAAAPDAALPPSAPSTAAPAAAPPQRPPANGRLRLDLRQVADGERRVRGVFESITCGQNRVVLMVRTDAGLQRFAAARILDVDFVSYRPGAPGSINCGTQTPLPVLATYRDLPAGALRDVDGQAVAIELLPDGFTQP